MHFRSLLAVFSLAALSMLGSCTSRYQDLLRDRDAQIRELNGRVASLRSEKEDLERQMAERAAPPKTEAAPASFEPNKLQNEFDGEATVDYRNGKLAIGVEDSVAFDSGSDKLKDTAHRVLKKIAAVLKRDFGACKYYIEGHTDSDPIAKTKDKFLDNRELGFKRANAVARYLIEQGIAENRIVVVSFAQYDPKDSKSKERNRRVEIVPTRQ